MVERFDCVIIGAGPAGCASAIALAQAGRSVALLDKAQFPRDKTCGDGLTTSALRQLEALGIEPTATASWLAATAITIVGPTGRTRRFPFESTGLFAATAARLDLDQALLDRAREAGAEIYESTAFKSLGSSSTSILTADGQRFSAPHLIAADGAWSPTRKALGLTPPGYLGDAHAYRQYVTGVAADPRNGLWVFFDEALLPGYGWAFPLADGRWNIGLGIHRNRSQDFADLKNLWKGFLSSPQTRDFLGPDWKADGPLRAWPIPARLGSLPLALGATLFVGDAAGGSDPLSGEGIGQALEMGTLAAEAILTSTKPAEHYSATLKRGLQLDLRLAKSMLSLLDGRRRAAACIALASSTPWVRRNFVRWLFEDYPRAVVATPHRWSRQMFSQPGAYSARSADDA